MTNKILFMEHGNIFRKQSVTVFAVVLPASLGMKGAINQQERRDYLLYFSVIYSRNSNTYTFITITSFIFRNVLLQILNISRIINGATAAKSVSCSIYCITFFTLQNITLSADIPVHLHHVTTFYILHFKIEKINTHLWRTENPPIV
jgi:hypothetical protein